jgi:hypothetical protein
MKQLFPNTAQSVATTPVLEALWEVLYFESVCCSLPLFLNHVCHLPFIVKLSTVTYNDLWRACRTPEAFANILTHSNITVLPLVSEQIKQAFCSNSMHVETLCQNSLAWFTCDSSVFSHSANNKTFVFMSSSPIHVWGTLTVSSPEISFSHLTGFCGSSDLFKAKLNADKLLTSGTFWSSKNQTGRNIHHHFTWYYFPMMQPTSSKWAANDPGYSTLCPTSKEVLSLLH